MLHAHSGLRWIVLLLLLVATVKALSGWLGKKQYTKSDNLIAVMLLGFTHLQALLGLVLYIMMGWGSAFSNMGVAMKDPDTRFWSIEHLVAMLLVVVFITVGRVRSKKASSDVLKHKRGAILYLLALLIVLWVGLIKPYMLGRGWF